ncbi:MAG TPA: hypothetical protein PKD64_07195 [Pirellulaceae bacterium]|nr:hypothetical protein [Pirellulaceae bacterium]HMO91970.1 hypothetical protein [Pirellulaceae bacterium]HMP68769.1 hypothetical protein [Pirellulaceae bacterium]
MARLKSLAHPQTNLFLISLAFAIGLTSEIQAQTEQNEKSFVLTTNDQLYHGSVSKTEVGYRIELANGIVVTLPPREVELHCMRSADIVNFKRRNLSDFSLEEQIKLFRWCCRYNLEFEAEYQLAWIRRLKLDEAILDQLYAEHDTKFNPRINFINNAPATREDAIKTNALNTTTRAEQTTHTSQDKTLAAMSVNAVGFKHFAKDIEAKLINGCTAAGCHSSSSAVMPLIFESRQRPTTKAMTERNLKEVLKYVNRTAPDESPILLMSITKHWAKDEAASRPIVVQNSHAVWDPDSIQFRYLRAWLHLIADRERSIVDNQAENPLNVDKASIIIDTEIPEGNAVKGVDVSWMTTAVAPETKNAYQPIDAFDPELFNRYQQEKRKQVINTEE